MKKTYQSKVKEDLDELFRITADHQSDLHRLTLRIWELERKKEFLWRPWFRENDILRARHINALWGAILGAMIIFGTVLVAVLG